MDLLLFVALCFVCLAGTFRCTSSTVNTYVWVPPPSSNWSELAENATDSERRLIQDLLGGGYEWRARPRRNPAEPVTVGIGLDIHLLQQLDGRDQVLTMYVWVKKVWIDEYLVWDPDEYGGIHEVVVPATHIWLPEIVVENSADTLYNDLLSTDFRAHVENTGRVKFVTGGFLSTSCKINLALFPFDQHTCTIRFCNWVYSSSLVRILPIIDYINLEWYTENGEWEVINTSMSKFSEQYTEDVFEGIHAYLTIRRKPLYYIIYVYMPTAILAVISLLVFFMPDTEGKISVGVTVLLSYSVFQFMLLDIIPVTSDHMPLMGIYISAMMVMNCVIITLEVIILNVRDWPPDNISTRLVSTRLFYFLANIFCVWRKSRKELRSNKTESEISPEGISRQKSVRSHGSDKRKLPISKSNSLSSKHCNNANKANGTIEHIDGWPLLGELLEKIFFATFAIFNFFLSCTVFVIIPSMSKDRW